MMLEAAVSILAVAISVISLVVAISSRAKDERASVLQTNLSAISDVERMIGDHPELLEFHGITSEELIESGFTSYEIAYLVASLTVGGAYYDILGTGAKEPFAPDSYRGRMLRSERTRKAWPIVRKLMEPSPYVDKLESTIRAIEQEELARPPKVEQAQ